MKKETEQNSVNQQASPVESDVESHTGENTTGARRRILRTLVTGGGIGATAAFVPTTWTKPVVDAVTLPAHAVTSVQAFNGAGVVGGPIASLEAPEESDFEQFVQNVRDLVIPEASAGTKGAPTGSCLTIIVADLNNPASPASVAINSQIAGSSSGNGTLAQLLNPGIATNAGDTVKADTLNPNGTGSGNVNGTPFVLTPGQCQPIDGEI